MLFDGGFVGMSIVMLAITVGWYAIAHLYGGRLHNAVALLCLVVVTAGVVSGGVTARSELTDEEHTSTTRHVASVSTESYTEGGTVHGYALGGLMMGSVSPGREHEFYVLSVEQEDGSYEEVHVEPDDVSLVFDAQDGEALLERASVRREYVVTRSFFFFLDVTGHVRTAEERMILHLPEDASSSRVAL